MPRDWQWTDVPRRVEKLWVKAQQALFDFHSQCCYIEQLLTSDLTSLAHWVNETCKHDNSRRQAEQLFTSQTDGGQFPSLLACILSKLLGVSAVDGPKLVEHREYSECVLSVTQALCSVLQVCGVVSPCSPGPIAVRLSLARQLQQAELLQPLGVAMEHMALLIQGQIAVAARSMACAAPLSCDDKRIGQDLQHHHPEENNLVFEMSREISESFLFLTVRICLLWPGGVYKSATARPLMPAAAKLAAVVAQMASHLFRENPNDKRPADIIFFAVLAAHRLATINNQAVAEQPVDSSKREGWNLGKVPEFRHLLLLLLAVHAQFWLDAIFASGDNADAENYLHLLLQEELVKQLWVPLGHMPELLPHAAKALRHLMAESETRYHPAVLMHELACSWSPSEDNSWVTAPAATAQQSSWPQLQQEFKQMLLFLRLTEVMFHVGPQGVHEDITLFVRAVSCFNLFLASASARFMQLAQQEEPADDVFDVCSVVQLLLTFLQISHKTLQKQQQQQDPTGGGSNCSVAGDLQHLQLAVLGVLQVLSCFTTAYRNVFSLQEAWFVYGCEVTRVMEQVLRSAVLAAADDGKAWSRFHGPVAPAISTWLRMMTSSLVSDRALQLMNPHAWPDSTQLGSRLAVEDVAIAEAGCSNPHNSIFWQVRLSSSSDAATVPDYLPSKADNISNPQAKVSALQLQVLSLMTSSCKAMLKTVELVPEAPVLLVQKESVATYLTVATANILGHHAMHQQQLVLLPGVRPWVSLLGRCLVMMGQRLRVVKEESSQAQLLKDHEGVLRERLQQQELQLATVELQQLEVAQMQQLQLLEQAAAKGAIDVQNLHSRLAAVKSDDQQLTTLLQRQLQDRVDGLQSVLKAKDKVMAEVNASREQQQQLQQQKSKLEAELFLCKHVNSCDQQDAAADLKGMITVLTYVGKVLLECRTQVMQEQLQYDAGSTGSSAAAIAALLLGVYQLQLPELLSFLVVVEGLYSLLTDDTVNSAVPGTVDASSAADTLARRYEEHVEDGLCRKFFMKALDGTEAGANCSVRLPTAAEAIAALLGDFASAQQDTICSSVSLSVLLSSKPYQQLHEQLVAIGSELITALPHCWCCNNPGCDNLSADCELQLISSSDKEQVCTGCTGGSRDKDIKLTAARYCSVECQTQHWKQHKRVCRRLHKQRKQKP